MTLKWLTSHAEHRNLHLQFGVLAATIGDVVQLGLQAVDYNLMCHKKSRVFWYRLIKNL